MTVSGVSFSRLAGLTVVGIWPVGLAVALAPTLAAVAAALAAAALAAAAFKGGIERRVEQIVVQAPGDVGGVGSRGPRPRPGSDLADWQPLAVDTWHSETKRRLLIHDRLANATSIRPDQLKRWLYKEVLHTDLDDPYLGLGDALFGDDVFRQDQ